MPRGGNPQGEILGVAASLGAFSEQAALTACRCQAPFFVTGSGAESFASVCPCDFFYGKIEFRRFADSQSNDATLLFGCVDKRPAASRCILNQTKQELSQDVLCREDIHWSE